MASALVGAVSFARAQTARYPTKPVRLVVPFEPGGGTDLTARLIAQKLGERFGQSFVVENRSGAGGNIGTDFVAKAKPDGYTLLWANVAPMSISPHLYKKLPYDPVRDFAPITLATVFSNVIVVRPSMSATPESFMEKAKHEFRDLTYASAGNGSSTHLGVEWLKNLLGAQWVHVPYRGGGPALFAVASGQVDFYLSSVPAALMDIRNGKLKPIATTGKSRDPALPEVPTIAGLGLPNYEVLNWNALVAPAATPRSIIDRLHEVTVEILSSPTLRKHLIEQGAEPAPMTAEDFAEFMKAESVKWAQIVKIVNAKVD